MLVKPQANPVARIKVVGVGGGGGNVVNTMVEDKGIYDVEFIAINTDSQALANSQADVKLKIGEQVTRGLGSGGNPIIGRKAAEESIDMIHERLAGADMIFITAGMGGGTGTGASPIVGEIAKNLGALTIAVVMKPFEFEGKRRMESALKGIEELKENVDTMVVIPNQRLLDIMEPNASFLDALHKSDEVLLQAVKSIANLSTQTGLINVDFADVRSIMNEAGTALMGMGSAQGEGRAKKAAETAINSPLLEVQIDGATGLLYHVVGGRNLGMHEIDEAAEIINARISPDANIIFGATIDPTLDDEAFEVTVIATGFAERDTDKILERVPRMSPTPQTSSYNNAGSMEEESGGQESVSKGNVFQPFGGEEKKKDDDIEDQPSFLRRRIE